MQLSNSRYVQKKEQANAASVVVVIVVAAALAALTCGPLIAWLKKRSLTTPINTVR